MDEPTVTDEKTLCQFCKGVILDEDLIEKLQNAHTECKELKTLLGEDFKVADNLGSSGVFIEDNHVISLKYSYIKLGILPESIGYLTECLYLHVGSCELTVIPESLGNLKKLKVLDIGFNQLFF